MAKQLVTVRYDVSAQAGLCLWYTQEILNVPHLFSTAHEAYLATAHKHLDRNFPDGVAVPVWFSWWGQLPGDAQKYEYDHAAVRAADGRIWSSPLTGKGHAVFNSVDDLVRAFGGGMKYVGWSEDISNVKVAELQGINDMVEDTQLNFDVLSQTFQDMTGRALTKAEFKDQVGRSWQDVLITFQGSVETAAYEEKANKPSVAPAAVSDSDKKLQAIRDALGIK
jgi:hypothetical protein